ncbi:MAG: hypothetical protein PHG94_05560 [Syntrophomonas sp.]|uniref:hypothetical protein n=1 Tax=Syntrophomonas sp. TaxID=2053627 RepID=UPI0026246185|nr:hypothetical protein [Syntrophomonas sp.]MDD2510577.1 hypothetical protein [Syntrophomonas sp.]MDD4626302.1 hypothetical protein [Syntrophomonas sp.]
MIAEIKGKISQTGYNLNDRLEDNLTGNVFGAMRYIPFNLALRNILAKGVYPPGIGELILGIKTEYWGDKVQFWPYDREGEIDVLVDFDDAIIGIEVKYLSGLSSDDDVVAEKLMDNEAEKSCNQLARESRIIAKKGAGKTKILLFIADSDFCCNVYEDVTERGIIEDPVGFGYLSWQSVLSQMQLLALDNPFYQIILDDVISLLIKKGFESFTNMYVTLDADIAPEGYYDFGAYDSCALSFETDILIEGGVYYEFS